MNSCLRQVVWDDSLDEWGSFLGLITERAGIFAAEQFCKFLGLNQEKNAWLRAWHRTSFH